MNIYSAYPEFAKYPAFIKEVDLEAQVRFQSIRILGLWCVVAWHLLPSWNSDSMQRWRQIVGKGGPRFEHKFSRVAIGVGWWPGKQRRKTIKRWRAERKLQQAYDAAGR